MAVLQAALGIVALLGLAWLCGENRRAIPWRTVAVGIGLQVGLALLLISVPASGWVLEVVNQGAEALLIATNKGTSFVFGYLGGPPLPFTETQPGASFILAFQALPMVLVVSALSALLFHWGALQGLVAGFAWLLRRLMGVSGPLALGSAVNVFVGMIEAPLLIRPYLSRMNRGELFALMTGGLAGVAGTVMVIYASFLNPLVPNALGNILIASVIGMPAAIAIAAVMVPFPPAPPDAARLVMDDPPASAMDALVKGTMDGVPVLVAIVATLIVTIAVVALINMALGQLPDWSGAPVTLQRLFAIPFRPVMWLLGVPWAETAAAADLMATKTVLNEFVAYLDFSRASVETFSPRTRVILTYALCGFANFGSVGITIGGLSMMVPERRREIVELGMRALLAGTLASCLSAAVAGALIG